jgi:hypothetical protein
MIKTYYKLTPAKGYTHSLGAQKISELLQGIRIYDILTIGFDKSQGEQMGVLVPGWMDRKLKGNSKELLEFRSLIYCSYSTVLDNWKLTLKPIKLENNVVVKKFLIEIGIPILRNWLDTDKSSTWYSETRYFQIGINENATEFCILETKNNLVVFKKREKIIS